MTPVLRNTLATLIGFSLATIGFANTKIDDARYERLLPKDGDKASYQMDIGQGSTPYHCLLTADYQIDLSSCDQISIDLANKNEQITIESTGATIKESKLWAMGLAHASMLTVVELQYGLNPNGLFDTQNKYGVNREAFGNYFMRNVGPNYYIAKAVQESSMGRDLPPTGPDDGVLQIEGQNGGSAWGELQGKGGGGFPNPFVHLDHNEMVASNYGPAENIVGSAIASAFYNASAFGINAGALPWDQGNDVIGQFVTQAQDPDALQILMSFMYNRGPYAAKHQVLDNASYCATVQDGLERDWACFNQVSQNDWGLRYIQQIPMVNSFLNTQVAKGQYYDERLTWPDVQAYLDLLAQYGFYPRADLKVASEKAKIVFDAEKNADGTLSFRQDFGRVLQAVIVSLPVYQFANEAPADQPNDSPADTPQDDADVPEGNVAVTFESDDPSYVQTYFQVQDEKGAWVVNDFVAKGASQTIPKAVQQVKVTPQFTTGWGVCSMNFTQPIQGAGDRLMIEVSKAGCAIYDGGSTSGAGHDTNGDDQGAGNVDDQGGTETDGSDQPALSGDRWDVNQQYYGGEVVVDPVDGQHYQAQWWVNLPQSQTPSETWSHGQNRWGVWRPAE